MSGDAPAQDTQGAARGLHGRLRPRFVIGVVLAFAVADTARWALLPLEWGATVSAGLEAIVCVFGALSGLAASRRSPQPARSLWLLVTLYLGATVFTNPYDVEAARAQGQPLKSALFAEELIGWCSYLPLALLAFHPIFDVDQSRRRWLWACDFALATIAVAFLYFHFVYAPQLESGLRSHLSGPLAAASNLLISAGLLLRAALDPSRQARAVYRRIGGVFSVITANALLVGAGLGIIRTCALLMLGLLAHSWRGDPDPASRSTPGQIGTRLALSLLAPATFVAVVLLEIAAPAELQPWMLLAAGLSSALFFARAVLAESSRYATEKALRGSEERFAKSFQNSPDGVLIRDLGSEGIIEVNERFVQLVGYTRQELLGRKLHELGVLDPEPGQRFLTQLAAYGSVRDFEFNVHRKDGTDCPVLGSAELVEIGGRPRGIVIMRDISAQKQAEARLLTASEAIHGLYARLAAVEDEERHALHTEVHDQVAANLSALHLTLGNALTLLGRGEAASALPHVESACAIVVESIAATRNLMADLRPPALDDYGLAAALRTFAATQTTRLRLPVLFTGPEIEPRPDALVENALFRIAHEAVMNAARHGAASRIRIEIAQSAGGIFLSVDDDGRGFDPAVAPEGPDHWGLLHMSERARAIRGTLRIASAPGAGTRVTVDAPRAHG